MFFCLLLAAPAGADVRLKPIFQGSFLGGVTQVQEGGSSSRGTIDVRFVPVVELGERTALLPILHALYAGNQSAVKVADEGSLLQQQREYHGELLVLKRLSSRWKASVRSGVTASLLKEADGERWGKGLYDHDTAFAGIGGERAVSGALPTSLRMGVEYSRTSFPNYQTLASQQGLGQAGTRNLDTRSWLGYLKGETSLGPRNFVEYGLALSQDAYPDQPVVTGVGEVSGQQRRDLYTGLNARWSVLTAGERFQTSAGLGMDLRRRASNQGAYDAFALRFFRNYYNYDEISVTPSFFARWTRTGMDGSLAATFTRRAYPSRPAQHASGAYAEEEAFTDALALNARVSYPLFRHLRALATASWYRASSNTTYEAFYNYNFRSVNYSLGVSAEF